jgi:hypothetical protein
MVFLLLMAIVAGTVMQVSTLEVFMAGNGQFREEAFQQAQAIASEISEDIDNFPVVGDIGYRVCPSGCDATFSRSLSSLALVSPDVIATYEVVRRGPLIMESLPYRQAENKVSSSSSFDVALFEARVAIDGRAARLGHARVVQGMAVRVASSGQ